MSRSKQPRPDILATPRRSKRRRDRLESDEEQQGSSRRRVARRFRVQNEAQYGQNESLRENMCSKELAGPYLLTVA
ncbi:hypothetical protein E4U14_006391 [Claviceps sp. LM454 group G7]|nr:hypothetical protein E4U14_006391 [Claviceps sp. LM454 group G7]